MKTYEFTATVTPEGRLDFPGQYIKKLPVNKTVKVCIIVDENENIKDDDNADWSRLAAEQFFLDYNDSDAIYDEI